MTRTTRIDRGLLLVRLALGLVFVAHGWQKIAQFGLGGTTAFLAHAGIPFPGVSAVLIMATELLGGLALLAGAGTRIAAGFLAFAMGVAIATVHLANGFFLPSGFEYALTLFIVNIALIVTGAGSYSIDATLAGRRPVADHPAFKAAA